MLPTIDSSSQLPIITLFETLDGDERTHHCYREVILRTLKKILPEDFFSPSDPDAELEAHQFKMLSHLLPLTTMSPMSLSAFPGTISFFALSKFRSGSFKFFFDMVSRWIVPGKPLNVVLIYASDFRLHGSSTDVYTVCEVIIRVDDAVELEMIQRHFPWIQAELARGLDSTFYAQRILEVKGLSADEKTASIQEYIAFLIKRFPDIYDNDILAEMLHVLLTCRDEFKDARQPLHLTRMIGVHYLFRRAIRANVKKKPEKRFLHLKLSRAIVNTEGANRRVLGIHVGVNFLRDQETLGEKHLVKAIQHHIPATEPVSHSFFINKRGSENISTLYLEVVKAGGEDFTPAEIRKLRKELPSDLKNRIEHRLHPIFMPRNEEETMRNIMLLTDQLKYLRDIPQVSISFDEQAPSHLLFTVIIARILKDGCRPIQEMMTQVKTPFKYIHDRVKMTGYIRNKYAKEATVFRLKLPKDPFLRADHSIDLYKARQTVVEELYRIIGEIRDFNGGMISKQHELLASIRELLVDQEGYDDLLLENFFYSLAPVVIRALLDPKAFKSLFVMLLKGLQAYKQEGYYVDLSAEPYNIFALVICEDTSIKRALHHAINKLHIPTTELANAYTKNNGHACIGYICCSREPEKKELFFQTIRDTLQQWEIKYNQLSESK